MTRGNAFSPHTFFKMKFLIFISFLIFSASAEMTRFDNYQVYTVSVENGEQLKALQYLDEHSDSVNLLFYLSDYNNLISFNLFAIPPCSTNCMIHHF